jgi:hypothetical protein
MTLPVIGKREFDLGWDVTESLFVVIGNIVPTEHIAFALH